MEKKTVKCIKCQQEVAEESCIKTNTGHFCLNCVKKNKKQTGTIIISIIVTILILVGLAVTFIPDKKKTVGFDGVERIQDSVTVTVDSIVTPFEIATAVALSVPVNGERIIDNIDSFKRFFAENLKNATETKDNSIIFPAISIFFNFESSEVSLNASTLLNEYAKVYLQTNKQAVLLVQGYACNCGPDDINNLVSKQRAESVRDTLISFGIPKGKVEIQWYGKSKNKIFSYPNKKDYRRVIVSIR